MKWVLIVLSVTFGHILFILCIGDGVSKMKLRLIANSKQLDIKNVTLLFYVPSIFIPIYISVGTWYISVMGGILRDKEFDQWFWSLFVIRMFSTFWLGLKNI